MAVVLPGDTKHLIDETCVLTSVNNLTEAVARGEIDLSVLKTFVSASRKGQTITFTKTKPVPLLMKEFIEAHPGEHPRRLIYVGLERGLWTDEDVERWEENATILSSARKTSVPKGTYLTRNRRTRQRIARVSDQFAPKIAMDIVCSHEISDGAKVCLEVLMALAGKDTQVLTYTTSIATMLKRTPRTVRNYFIALEEAGLITRTAGASPNSVKIVIHPACRPEPYVEPRDIRAFKLARRSPDPALRDLAETLTALSWQRHCEDARQSGGRKLISAFNLESNPMNVEEGDGSGDGVGLKVKNSGATTHSDFHPLMKTDRNRWRPASGPRKKLDQPHSALPSAPESTRAGQWWRAGTSAS
ncbi:hypothetical protein GOB57_08780 [Sinorhizobium meliloti]|nr:hypothetical protein [Sinorhizobium meliloti]